MAWVDVEKYRIKHGSSSVQRAQETIERERGRMYNVHYENYAEEEEFVLGDVKDMVRYLTNGLRYEECRRVVEFKIDRIYEPMGLDHEVVSNMKRANHDMCMNIAYVATIFRVLHKPDKGEKDELKDLLRKKRLARIYDGERLEQLISQFDLDPLV